MARTLEDWKQFLDGLPPHDVARGAMLIPWPAPREAAPSPAPASVGAEELARRPPQPGLSIHPCARALCSGSLRNRSTSCAVMVSWNANRLRWAASSPARGLLTPAV